MKFQDWTRALSTTDLEIIHTNGTDRQTLREVDVELMRRDDETSSACGFCLGPIVGDPVVDPEQARWLPASQVAVFCSFDCLDAAAEGRHNVVTGGTN
jgi:hypothetical protein